MIEPAIGISGRNRAAKIKRRYEAVLSIQDVNQRHPLRFHQAPYPPHLRLCFEDYDGERKSVPGPELAHAKAILNFGHQVQAKRLLIHCNAGYSRSTAAALGILVQANGNNGVKEAWRTLDRIRPYSCPNRPLLMYFDDLLRTGGALLEEAERRFAQSDEWRERSYLQNLEIEKEFP